MRTEKTKPSLLLVEDSEDDAYFFRRTLQKSKLGCHLHHSMNGAEAIDFLRGALTNSEEIPAVMFLDLKMPVLNGFEVLAWLQTQTFASRIQVVVLSGSEHQSDRDRAAQLGAADYLVKPVTISDLEHFLRDLCPPVAELGAPV